MPGNMLTLRVEITGRVQGVNYRYWTLTNANRLNVDGWVRNRDDGSVEALFHGVEEDVNELVRLCHEGPPSANVTAVETRPDNYDGTGGFEYEPLLG